MQRKAAIYIRTSSETQGERASPSEQEEDDSTFGLSSSRKAKAISVKDE